MKFNNFFRASWMIQLLVGIGLFSVSFVIENQIMQAFLSAPLLALCLAVTLEIGKAVAIIWHRYLSMATSEPYPLITRIASGVFRAGLVVLSLICSLLFLADHLDRPNLKAVRSGELHTVQQQLKTELARLDAQEQQRVSTLKHRQQVEYTDTRRQYDARINKLQADLNNEMNNVVDGVFKGQRYIEFERLLHNEKTALQLHLNDISQRHLMETSTLDQVIQQDIGQARQAVISKAQQQKNSLMANDYAQDERVNDSRIVAFLKISDAVFHLNIEPLQFVFLFSILLSVLMEVGIVLAFDTVTVAMIPALRAQHKADIETQILKSKMAGETRQESMWHNSEMNRVAKRADRTMEEAEAMYDRFSDQTKW